jgi:polyphosphate kinase
VIPEDKLQFNMVNLLKTGLQDAIKSVLTEELVRDEMKEHEAKFRETIAPLIERITVGEVSNFNDIQNMRSELEIYISLDGKKPTKPTEVIKAKY